MQLNLLELANQLQHYSIPPRPNFLVEIEEVIDSDDPDLNRIAELVSQDIGVGSFAVQVVNSPLFGLPVKVHSVDQAIRFLGLNRSIKLVRSVALRYSLGGNKPSLFEQHIWDSTQLVSQCCMLLARRHDWLNENEAYSLGLFHNAGMILMRHHVTDYPQIVENAYHDVTECISHYERDHIGSSHAVIGALLANSWGLGNILSQVIGLHHESISVYEQLPGYLARPLALLKTAEYLSGIPRTIANSEDREWLEVSDWALSMQGISDADLDEVEEAIAHLQD